MTAARHHALDSHVVRLLLLCHAFTSRDRDLDGLTKIAKLDFLLRYPVMLARLLAAEGRKPDASTEPSNDERRAVESRMTRYKYGPWDDRYYPIVGALVGMGLCETVEGRGRIALKTTEKGAQIAERLAEADEWRSTSLRCKQLARDFDRPGSQLKDLIYRHLPDVVDRPHRASI